MHYYKFNIADYKAHTSHLSLIEDICYRRMLDWQYLHEKPLPKDINQICRLLMLNDCSTPVQQVLNEFFKHVEDGYINVRAFSEIQSYKADLIKKSKAGKESAASRKLKLQQLMNACSTGVEQTTNHKPGTNNQEPEKPLVGDDAPDDPDGEPPKDDPPPECPHQEIIALYHKHLPELTRVRTWTETRASALRTRWRENPKHQSLEFWEKFFIYVSESDFLMGRETKFQADLEWLIKSSNFVKVAEGKYENKAR